VNEDERAGASRRPVVLFCALTGHLGGPTRSLATLLPQLTDFERVLAVPRRGAFADRARNGRITDRVVWIPRTVRLRQLSRILAAARILVWTGRRRRRLAVIHANGTAELNVVAPAAWLFRKRVVVWAHGSELDPSSRRLLPIWVRRLALTWAAVSETAAAVLADAGIRRADVSIIPNPIDDDALAPHQQQDAFVVTFLGSPLPSKGLDLVPDVVRRAGTDIDWLLCTERWHHPMYPDADAPFDELEQFPSDRVRIVGHVTDVAAVYARTSVVFCPSRQESFCRVAAEAMANGIPVVGSAIPALQEVVGDAGILFEPGDAAAAAHAIDRLRRDQSLARELGARGVRRAAAFAPAAVAGAFTQLYDRSPAVRTGR
jgi:glycosyltransferase involved in cell wall biosynthesis